ncbi:BTAD domain-containing putative transcriptional regulator [Deinococcus cellulosilyticus]|uniref:Bacterial transcriptional activator domain-containing protein n=1 Tax=Deinococcus cellulosilyticus (strain DSM 18568 / NBRC 106333 / KACC 11606 / 5516J-15) TaxID=1223518 RepID=A0A511N227_DEIC1|nr:BTAD domain-containing putative transcriptional regulator [Deinococcus cellulosilyticus]GEM46915.1 hypothetical protein DC3_25500 [Deinococcus cellulosilyticus NBRC 106333 = KACC 11606]
MTGTPTHPWIPRPLRFELARPHLIQKLSETLHVTVVALLAPSGYGKSTLLAQYARSTLRPVVWVSCKEDALDPWQLSEMLLQMAAQQADVQVQTGFTTTLPAATTARRLAAELSRLNTNLDFVFDDVDLMGEEALQWLHAFMGSVGEGHRVLLCAYGPENLRLARFLAEGTALILDTHELAFHPEETASFLQLRGLRFTQEQVHHQLEGWPAGIALYAAGATQHYHPTDLVKEAVGRLPRALQKPLCELAVVRMWSEEVVRQLEIPLPEDWLETLLHAGLPLTPVGNALFKPHQVLLSHLGKELQRDPERLQVLSERAATLLERQGEQGQAYHAYLQARRYTDALRVLEQLVPQLEQQKDFRRLRELLEKLPESCRAHPLTITLAHSLIQTGAIRQGRVLLESLRGQGKLTPEGYAFLASATGRQGNPEQQLQLALEGKNRLQTGERCPRLSWQVASALMTLGRYSEAEPEVESLLQHAEERGTPDELGMALTMQQYLLFAQERYAEQKQVLTRAVRLYDSLGLAAQNIPLLLMLAEIEGLEGQMEAASSHLQQIRRLALEEGSVYLPQITECHATLKFWEDELTTALGLLEDALKQAEDMGLRLFCAQIQYRMCDVLLRQGKPELFQQTLEEAERLGASVPLYGTYRPFFEGVQALQAGQLQEAFALLRQVTERPPERQYLVRALALMLDIAKRLGLDSTPIQSRLDQALAGCTSSPVLQLEQHLRLSAQEVKPEETPPAKPLQGPVLNLRTLGGFAAERDGQVLRISLSRSVEVLVWLAVHGPSTRDSIVDALWEGSSEEKNYDYFRVAVRRLRADLQAVFPEVDNPVPFDGSVYRLSGQLQLQLDLHTIQQAMEQPSAEHLKAALDLYRGDFLPEVETEWASVLREEYREKTIHIGLKLATEKLREHPLEAMTLYRRILKIDPYHQGAYLGVMETAHAIGGIPAAQQAFEHYRTVMEQELFEELDPVVVRKVRDLGVKAH